jgi:hypothetical protein
MVRSDTHTDAIVSHRFVRWFRLEFSVNSANVATHILLAFHMLLINILLVNLLIAMFK